MSDSDTDIDLRDILPDKFRCGKVLAFESLEAHYYAELSRALHELKVYFDNPAGIGEHSDLQVEMRKKLEEIGNAKDCLSVLDQLQRILLPE